MSAKKAALLTVLMVSGIIFMAAGLYSVDASGHVASSDGYGISSTR
ncbi:hypothetical protein ACFO1V_10500 [Daeguia caeni]|uniref:Uncharacterized protein n=1 Tax=Daeguia caeni TaxID=439612 RepID=A0ABV9H8G0_9HYPH